jgi:hypothetical protein
LIGVSDWRIAEAWADAELETWRGKRGIPQGLKPQNYWSGKRPKAKALGHLEAKGEVPGKADFSTALLTMRP